MQTQGFTRKNTSMEPRRSLAGKVHKVVLPKQLPITNSQKENIIFMFFLQNFDQNLKIFKKFDQKF